MITKSEALFMDIHGSLKLDNCIKLKDLMGSRELQLEHGISKQLTSEMFSDIVKFCGAKEESFYFNPESSIYPLFIYIEGCTIDMPSFDVDTLGFMQTPERVAAITEEMATCLRHNRYDRLFGFIDKKFRFEEFLNRLKDIPSDQLYDVFEHVYTSGEKGFEIFSVELLEYVEKHSNSSSTYRKNMIKLRDLADLAGNLTVYRGQGYTNLGEGADHVQSWSLNKETAQFFATRFNHAGTVDEKVVHVRDVRFYITCRSEAEVLIF